MSTNRYPMVKRLIHPEAAVFVVACLLIASASARGDGQDGKRNRRGDPSPEHTARDATVDRPTVLRVEQFPGADRSVDIERIADEERAETVNLLVRPGSPAVVREMTHSEVAARRRSAVASNGDVAAIVYHAGESGYVAQPWGAAPCAAIADQWVLGNSAGPMGTNGAELVEYTVGWYGSRCILSTGGGCTALCAAGGCELCGGDGVNGGGDEIRNTPCATPYTVTVGLYEPPCGPDDSTIGGAEAKLIPGTEAVFTSDLCCGDPVSATIDLRGLGIDVPGEVWVFMSVDRDDWGLRIGGIPTIGESLGNGDWYIDSDDDGCNDAWSCFNEVGVFGCDAGPPFEPCDWMFGTARAVARTTISVVPVGNDPEGNLDPGVTIVGNEMIMESANHDVWFEMRTGDWDPDDAAILVYAYELRLDPDGYTSGLVGTLAPRVIPCEGVDVMEANAVCAGALGPGSQCDWGSPAGGPPAACDDSLASPYGADAQCFCMPAFVHPHNRNFVFPQAGAYPAPPPIDLGSISAAALTDPPDSCWSGRIQAPPYMPSPGSCWNGNFCIGGGNCEDGGPCNLSVFPSNGMYLGSLALGIPTDARGTFTIALSPTGSCSRGLFGSVDGQSSRLPLVAFSPARVTINIPAPRVVASGVPKVRYLSFREGTPGLQTAVRVELTDLPAPFDVYNGRTMWVGEPIEISEAGAVDDPAEAPGYPTFMAATLQCQPYVTDWGSLGDVHISHALIVPEGLYSVQAIFESDLGAGEGAFSVPLAAQMAEWGDVTTFYTGQWPAPDGEVNVAADAIAVMDKFRSVASAPIKARCDVEPATPDRIINITDATEVIDAFRGLPYPFPAPSDPCP